MFALAFTDPALDRVLNGAAATAEAEAIPPSDDKRRDVLNLVQGMESIVASTYQQYTGMFNDPSLREPTITCGVRGARHSALLALTTNPGGYVAPSAQAAAEVSTDTLPGGSTTSTVAQNIGNTTTTAQAPTDAGPTMTVIPENFALTSTFGSTSAITVVLGAGDVNGTRLKVLLETPSLNSIEYEFLGACP
jgi:hypothetical protein